MYKKYTLVESHSEFLVNTEQKQRHIQKFKKRGYHHNLQRHIEI